MAVAGGVGGVKLITRRGDFTPQAEAYARARPGYPAAMVDRLIELAGVAPGDAVVDLGAGTGIFSHLLAARGLRVTAVEPNDAMRAAGDGTPLDGGGERHPVEWRRGTFEDTTLPDRSQRWAVAAQAFHWADPPRALPEMRRILRPGGAFSVLWNNRDVEASDVLRFTRAAVERRVPAFDEGYRARDWAEVLTSTGDFDSVECTEVRHVVTMSRARYLDLWRSHNLLNTTAGPEIMAGFLAELEDYLAQRDAIDVPYVCRGWTARQRTG